MQMSSVGATFFSLRFTDSHKWDIVSQVKSSLFNSSWQQTETGSAKSTWKPVLTLTDQLPAICQSFKEQRL